MTNSSRHVSLVLEAWRQADAHARELEFQLTTAWVAFDETRGPPPNEKLLAQVALFRAIAHEKLSAVLEELRAVTSHEPNEVTGGWREPHAS
jgi:hypothetical protein